VLLNKVLKVLEIFEHKYVAYISGHTSIDIMHKDYNKKTMLQQIMILNNLSPSDVVFVGNETEKGSEAHIKDIGVRTIQVDDIYECNILLKTLNTR